MRLLAREGGNTVRALARGHRAPLTDVAFAPAKASGAGAAAAAAPAGAGAPLLLATADEEGCVGVWTVEVRKGSLDVIRAALFKRAGAGGGEEKGTTKVGGRVAWHPATPGLLAASVGGAAGSVFLVDCAAVAETSPADDQEAAAAAAAPAIELAGQGGAGPPPPAGVVELPSSGAGEASPVTALAFSPSGSHLAAGTLAGSAQLWALPGGGDAEDAVDAAAAARPPSVLALGGDDDERPRLPVAVEFVPCPGPPVLLAHRGASMWLFDTARAARSPDGAGSELAALALADAAGEPSLAGLTSLAVAAAPSVSASGTTATAAAGLLPPLAVISHPQKKLLVAVTLSGDGRAFAALAVFKVASPVLAASFVPPAALDSDDGSAAPLAAASSTSSSALSFPHWAQLLAAQREAVQVLSLDAAACSAAADGGAAARAAAEAAAKAAAARKAASRRLGGAMLLGSSPSASSSREPSSSAPAPVPAPLSRLLTPSALARASSAASSGPASPAAASEAAAPLPKPVAAVKLAKATAPPAAAPPSAPAAPEAAAPPLSSTSVASIIAEIKAEGARSAAAAEAATARAVAAAAAAAAEDRAMLLATEHAALEKLLTGVSASVNRDLPARIEEVVKREVRAAVGESGGGAGGGGKEAAAAAAASAAAAATAASSAAATKAIRDLDLASAASAAVSAALPAALSAALPAAFSEAIKPALAEAVEKSLLPAFERCCKEMFAQVQVAFAGGLAEHLAAAGENAHAGAESLRESVERLERVSAAVAAASNRGGAVERGGRRGAAAAAASKGKAPATAAAAATAAANKRGKAREGKPSDEDNKVPSPSPTKEEDGAEEEEQEEGKEEKDEVEAAIEAREAEAEAEEEEEALESAAAAAAKEKEAERSSEEDEDDFAPDDPKAPIQRLVAKKLYGQAFEAALDLSDVAVVEWLASEVSPTEALADGSKDPLSQPVLLALLQQLGSDLSDEDGSSDGDEALQATKLAWVREAAMELDPEALGPALTPHVRPILAGLVAELKKKAAAAGGKNADSARAAVHVVNSVLHQCS